MKVFFISIILLFNAVPAFAGDYIRDIDNNVLIWDNKPQDNTAVSWLGCTNKNGFADGFGLATWYINGKFQVGYFGTMTNGKFNSHVNSFDLRGNYAQGSWVNGRRGSDWKLIKDSSLKKLAQNDVDSLLKIVRQSSHQNCSSKPSQSDDSLYSGIGSSFFKGMANEAAKTLGAQTVKLIMNIFTDKK